jgi:excisionase family DNA binding protein
MIREWTEHDKQAMSPDHLLLPMEVATLFKVDSKTITRWALQGKLKSSRTLGGHRRYRWGDVQEALERVTAELEPARDGRECGDAQGTITGYHRHIAHGDVPCDPCAMAWRLSRPGER